MLLALAGRVHGRPRRADAALGHLAGAAARAVGAGGHRAGRLGLRGPSLVELGGARDRRPAAVAQRPDPLPPPVDPVSSPLHVAAARASTWSSWARCWPWPTWSSGRWPRPRRCPARARAAPPPSSCAPTAPTRCRSSSCARTSSTSSAATGGPSSATGSRTACCCCPAIRSAPRRASRPLLAELHGFAAGPRAQARRGRRQRAHVPAVRGAGPARRSTSATRRCSTRHASRWRAGRSARSASRSAA